MNFFSKIFVVWCIAFVAGVIIVPVVLPGCSVRPEAEAPALPKCREIKLTETLGISEVEIEGCQYLLATDVYQRISVLTHKGNCTNHSASRR